MENLLITQISKEELIELIQEGIAKSSLGQSVNNTPEKFIGITEASAFLQIAIPTIYNLTSKHEIPHLKKGKKLLFRLSELEKWMDEGQFGNRKETAL